MTASPSETPPRNDTRYGRRILWLGAIVAIAIAVYTGVWFHFAGKLRAATDETIANLRASGAQAECIDAGVAGYPTRIGVSCVGLRYAAPDGSIAIEAGPFRSAARIDNLRHIYSEVEGPATVEVAGFPALGLTWSDMAASVRLAEPLPEAASMEGRDLAVALGEPDSAPVLRAADAQLHMRTRGADLDLASSFRGLGVDPSLTGGVALPALEGAFDATVMGGATLDPAEVTSLRGLSGEIRSLTLSLGADAGLAVSGPLRVDADGRLDGTLQVQLRNPREAGRVLSEALPQFANQIATAVAGLSLLGDNPSLPLTLSQGRARIGFIDLGEVPPF